MKDVVYFFRVTLIKPALEADVLCEPGAAAATGLCGLLELVAVETADALHFFELHPLDLATLFKLEPLVVAEFAGVEHFAAGGLDVA